MRKKLMKATLMLVIMTAMALGMSTVVSAGMAYFDDAWTQSSVELPIQNGISAVVVRTDGGVVGDTRVPNTITFSFTGNEETTGLYRVTLSGNFTTSPRIQYFRSPVGAFEDVVFGVVIPTSVGLVVPTFEFVPDISKELQGLTATAVINPAIPVGGNSYPVVLSLRGVTTASGTYTVGLTTPAGITVSPDPQTLVFRNEVAVNNTIGHTVTLADDVGFAALENVEIVLTRTPLALYTVDYVRETIFFDEPVFFALVTNTETFRGPRYERNLSRVRWQSTRTNEINIERMIPRRVRANRTVSVIVRRVSDPQGTPVYIELSARPANRAYRPLRRTIYSNEHNRFENTATTTAFDLRFDADVNHDNILILAAAGTTLDNAGALWAMHPDLKPSGVRGTIRIAANPAERTFSSLPLRFRTRPQPAAPRADRMAIGERRIAGVRTNVVNGTTARMQVWDGETYVPVTARIPVADFHKLFTATDDGLGEAFRVNRLVGNELVPHYRFEFRFPAPANFRRPISRAGFWEIPVADFYEGLRGEGVTTPPAITVG